MFAAQSHGAFERRVTHRLTVRDCGRAAYGFTALCVSSSRRLAALQVGRTCCACPPRTSTHQKRTRTPNHTCQHSVYSRNTL
eukprot:1739976-Prymnesium_polylepis.1